MAEPATPGFAEAVLDWFDVHGRHDLPWQQNPTPYRVWVSEIMLQQTQVGTVLDYFSRFMEAFPQLADLAAAEPDEVLHLWTGLGYYSRARNLHKAARQLMSEHQGQFPQSVSALAELPGIGRSTAGAIASISMGLRAPILDGNVKRVLARHAAIEGYPGESAVTRRLWALAEACTPQDRVGDYTQAMMDLGATLCRRTRPSCLLCPVQASCQARQQGREASLPTPRPRKTLPQRQTLMPLLTREDGSILLQQRPAQGIWGGLWSLPELPALDQLKSLTRTLAVDIGPSRRLPDVSHTFTHFRLQIEVWQVQVRSDTEAMTPPGWVWYNPNMSTRLGLPAPILKLMEQANSRFKTGDSP